MKDKNLFWFGGLAVFLVLSGLVFTGKINSLQTSLSIINDSNNFVLDVVGDGSWVCIAEKCDSWVSGEAWANEFCDLQNGSLMCEVTIEGDEYVLPIERFNISKMKSCIQKSCVTEVYVRKYGGRQEDE